MKIFLRCLLQAFAASLAWAAGMAYAAAPQPAQNDEQIKAALNGAIEARAHYLGDVTIVKISTKRLFHTPQEKQKALQAAKLIQRDVANFCQNSCIPEASLEPLLLRNGQLIFALRFKGLGRQLFQEDLLALLQGLPPLPVQTTPAGATGIVRTSTSVPAKAFMLRH